MMNKQLLLTCFLLGMLLSAQLTQGQSYTPLAITSGFNEDVIAEDRPASTYTTAAVDATNSGANNAFMSENYPDAKVGLPANGLIHSIATATPGLTFQLADYDKKNSLKINADNGTGTLTVQTTQKLSILYILATSGSSVSTFTGTITFTDGTQQAFATQSVPDWYDQGTPAIAIMGIGRVPRSGSENPDNNTTNPKLFQVAIDIDMVNQDKIIQQVAVIKTSSTSGFLNIFALSGEITPTCRKPVDLGIQNLTATSVELTWNSPGHAFDIKWGDRNFAVATAGILVTGFANGGTLTGLTADRDYDYYVRQNCGVVDGVSIWAGPFRFRTGYCIPTGAENNPDEILNFTLSNLNNNSVTSEGTAGYKNYAGTVDPAVLEIGEAYVASLTSGPGSGFHGAAIWIDYNNNLVFDANEQVSVIGNTISSSTTVDFPSFTVPATVQPGLYRLRVQYHHNKPGADLDPCRLARIYGETEDYRVEIIPTPTCFRPLDSRVQRVSKNSAHVVWDAPIQGDPPALGYKIEVRTSGYPGDATGLVRTLTTTNLSETITGLAIETDYLVYIRSLCSTTDESIWSKVAFTTLCDYPEYELTTDPTDLSFCGSRAVTLEVDTQGIVNWYDSETATTPIHTGNTYTTTVSATSSFWYQVVTPDVATIPTGPLDAEEVGPSRNNWIKDWGVYFTILEPTLLKSIDIYPTTARQYGEMKFVQRGGTGATIGEINYTTVGDLRTEKQVVPINIRFEPGDYIIETNLPVDGILRNTADASYPYSSAVASITGNEYQLSYYMGYYNWIFETGCKAIREEVVVTVMPSHSIANATVAVTATEGATLQITSAASSFTIEYGLRGFEQGTGTVVEGVGHSYGFSSLRGYTAYDVYIQAQPCGPLYGPLTFTTQAPTDTQVITVSDLSKNYGDLPFVTGSSDSGLPLSYHVENEAVAVFEQGQLVIKGAGTTRITASQVGDAQYVPAADVVFTLTVNKAMLTITAEANQQKVYGDPDPVFTFDVDGLQYEDDASIVTGLGRAAGEAVGTYPLEQANLTAGPNYEITFVGADFAITEATLTVTAETKTKAYGATDPALTYTVTGLQNGDQATQVLTGQLSRQVGEAVGTYAINQGSLAVSANYTLVYEGADFTITEAILTVTATAQTKAYGDTDPALTYTVHGLQNGDQATHVITGQLARQAGESVGTYAINQGSLAVSANYTLVYEGADFTISPIELVIYPQQNQAKVYGTADPVLTFTAVGLSNGDTLAMALRGALGRSTGENVGHYPYTLGSLESIGNNYVLRLDTAEHFEITPTSIDIVVEAGQNKRYGQADPVLKYSIQGLRLGDYPAHVMTGQLEREAGETVGHYSITQGSLASRANYLIRSFTTATFEIKRAAIQGLSLPSKTVVYDGNAQYLQVEGSLKAGATVTYENNGQTQVGRYTVVATIANEPNYEPLRLEGALIITPAEQYIRFEAVSTVVLEDTPSLPLQAVASSGLAVNYTIDDSAEQAIAQVDAAGVIHFLKPGFVTVTAHQEGNANYQAAVPVSQTIQVRSRDTTISNLVVDGVSYGKIPREVYVDVGCEGLKNSVLIEVETAEGALVFPSSTIVVDLPEYGTYKQEIEVLAEDGVHRETYTVIIEKRMPWEGLLLQKYDNLVFVNNNPATNGGYTFSKYEWYKNGQKVAEKQVFSEGGTSSDLLNPTAEYYAVLYTNKGQVFTTCPMQVTRKNTYSMAVYPNPVGKNTPLTIRFDYPVEAFKTSEYTIYNTLGQFITKGQLEQAVSVIDLPFNLATGAYILVIKFDGKPQSVRFIVK